MTQAGIYVGSILLAPLGLVWGIRYLRQSDQKSKIIGIVAIVLTLLFGRGKSALDRSLGDQANKPNPCLGAIENGPFYAVEIFPGDVSSTAGLRADANGQAVDANDVPIPGLYVCGNDANSLWAGNGLANGVYNGPSLTFGYIIGKQLAQASA